MRFFLSLAYNGKPFSGWQRQLNANSVQQSIEEALSKLIGEPIALTGAGRTDAGVSASCFYAHFDCSCDVKESTQFLYKLNAILPPEIVVFNIFRVDDNAHARFDAICRSYRYFLHTKKDPFADSSLFYKFDIDVEKMNKAAEFLLGRHDFSSFEKIGSDNKTSICTVSKAEWTMTDNSHYVFHITADRFLRNMVRSIVGTLLDVGRGKMEPEEMQRVISSCNRAAAGQSVPGEALFLCDIRYPYELYPIE